LFRLTLAIDFSRSAGSNLHVWQRTFSKVAITENVLPVDHSFNLRSKAKLSTTYITEKT
jgi:hypothetical protein